MKYKIIVDKQPSNNPSSEKKEYTIDIEELRVKGNIYDSVNITPERTYVTRRLALSEYGVLSELVPAKEEELKDLNIELFEGDNYIYLYEMQGNRFCAEYIVKNDFTEQFATKNEMNSAINQSAKNIELNVNQKLTGYSTTEEMNSAIKLSAGNITSTVSKSYATKTDLATTKTEIKQTTDSISNTVSKKVGKTEIISSINQSAEAVSINANKININGAISANGNFKVDNNGNMQCNNATITGGNIEVTGGTQDSPHFSINEGANRVRAFPTGIWIYSGSDAGDTGIMIERENGSTPVISVGQTNYPTVLYQTYMKCQDYRNYSKLESKENIEKFSKSGLDIIRNTEIYNYDYKNTNRKKRKIGFIIDENYKYSREITDDEESSVDLYAMISVAYKAIQELQKKIEVLEGGQKVE